MALVTYDGRSFMLDGRRLWIAGGSIEYARLPRNRWADRIALAKRAGINTISVPVVWSRHESRPGHFDFEGENDIRHFIELCGQAGMFVYLRLGPYVGSGYDAGGIPAWLLARPGVELRTANAPFLEACSRFLTALCEQIKDLQVESPGKGGPILLVQSEHNWTCGHDELARKYLGELLRYIREAGLSVPVINANGLWQMVEGEIECWTGAESLLEISRQLSEVHPKLPRLVGSLPVGSPCIWGESQPESQPAELSLRNAAQALAGCAQFVIEPFAGGVNFDFMGGRLPDDPDAFLTTQQDCGALVAADGSLTHAYSVMRRITMFTSRFGRLLANLDPEDRSIVLEPTIDEVGPTIVPVRGSQGSLVFVFGRVLKRSRAIQYVPMLLRDGSVLEVPMGSSGTAWCVFDMLLDTRNHLDYSSLSAFALVGSVLVCFGPTGARGVVCINGAPLDVVVPGGKKPLVCEHEGISLVIANEDQLDWVQVTDEGVWVGVVGFDHNNEPIATPGGKQYTFVAPDGTISTAKAPTAQSKAKAATETKPIALSWEYADTELYTSGQSPRYAVIPGPADLTTLGAPYGYGWYRLRFRSNSAHKVKLAAPLAGDRLQLFLDGQSQGVIGRGPGAEHEVGLSLKKAEHDLVVLAENFGRVSGGSELAACKGLYGELYEYEPFKVGRHAIELGEPIELLSQRMPLWETRQGDMTHPERLVWSFIHRRKSPIILAIGRVSVRGMLLLNGEMHSIIEPELTNEIVLDSETLNRGNNTIELVLTEDSVSPEEVKEVLNAIAKQASFYEGRSNLANKVEWSFAQWEMPNLTSFDDLPKTLPKGPGWYLATFPTPEGDNDLTIDLSSMGKGQIYLNGTHVGRYVVSVNGKAVLPEHAYLLPRSLLKNTGINELVLFDEYGGNPKKCVLQPLAQ